MFGIEDFSQKIVDFENFEVSQLGDALLFGGSMLLIGMLTVFSVLVLLWIFLTVFKLVFQDASKKAKSVTETPVVVKSPVAAAAPDEGEIVAVIAAAIAMAESENSDMKFRVVSFKRK